MSGSVGSAATEPISQQGQAQQQANAPNYTVTSALAPWRACLVHPEYGLVRIDVGTVGREARHP